MCVRMRVRAFVCAWACQSLKSRTLQLQPSDSLRPGVFRLAQGSWNELPSANLLTPFNIEKPDDPRFITHAVGMTMTFSAYALIILEKPVFTTQVAPRTHLHPRRQPLCSPFPAL